MKPYPHHPYADILPFRDGQSLIELSDSMKEHGQFEDIVLLDKQVLEGRRRQAAAIRAGMTPRYRKFGSRDGDGDDPLEYAFRVNFDRRNMSEAERVLAARSYANLKKGANPPKDGFTRVSQAEAAKKFKVSQKQIERANKVMSKGVKELQEAVKGERVSISDAAAICDEPEEVQRQAVHRVDRGECSTLQGAVKRDRAECPLKLAGELEAWILRLREVATEKANALAVAIEGATKLLALVRKLKS